MKTFFITLALFFICLIQGLFGAKVTTESETEHYGRCGYRGYPSCGRGYHNRYGRRYWGYPYGFGYRGCYRSCYRRGICC